MKQTLWLKYGFFSPLINPNQMAFTCHMEAISQLSISPNKHHFLSHSYFDNLSTAYTVPTYPLKNKQRLPPLPIHLFRSAGICLSAAVISRQLTSAQPTSLYTDSLPAQRNHHSSPAPAPLPASTASHMSDYFRSITDSASTEHLFQHPLYPADTACWHLPRSVILSWILVHKITFSVFSYM